MSKHFSATSLLIQLFDMTQNFSLFIHKFASHSIHNICAVDFFFLSSSLQCLNKSSFSVVTFSLVVRFLAKMVFGYFAANGAHTWFVWNDDCDAMQEQIEKLCMVLAESSRKLKAHLSHHHRHPKIFVSPPLPSLPKQNREKMFGIRMDIN